MDTATYAQIINDVHLGVQQVGPVYLQALIDREAASETPVLRPVPVVIAALFVANNLHREQRRKGPTKKPYITHPIQVAEYVAAFGGSEDQQAAALLHDTVEDTGYLPEELFADFGPRIGEMVMACSENSALKRQADQVATWKLRKQDMIDRLQEALPDSLLVKGCDLLHNTRDLLSEYEADASTAAGWAHSSLEGRVWYTREMLAVIRQRTPDSPVVAPLDEAVERLAAFVQDPLA